MMGTKRPGALGSVDQNQHAQVTAFEEEQEEEKEEGLMDSPTTQI